MRTIKIPAMIFTGIFPERPGGAGDAAAGRGATGTADAGEPGDGDSGGMPCSTATPQFSQNFITSERTAPQLVQNFCPIQQYSPRMLIKKAE